MLLHLYFFSFISIVEGFALQSNVTFFSCLHAFMYVEKSDLVNRRAWPLWTPMMKDVFMLHFIMKCRGK